MLTQNYEHEVPMCYMLIYDIDASSKVSAGTFRQSGISSIKLGITTNVPDLSTSHYTNGPTIQSAVKSIQTEDVTYSAKNRIAVAGTNASLFTTNKMCVVAQLHTGDGSYFSNVVVEISYTLTCYGIVY